ncbi:MAG: SUMF1/EgtB/PvdO family nonheme iron enzyme, partial [Anaerolineae bacterium]
DRWREVFLLAAGYSARINLLGQALNAVNALCPFEPDAPRSAAPADWPAAPLAAMALLEIGLVGVQREPVGQAVQQRVQRWLQLGMRHDVLTPRERAEAGRSLARLGDPRDEVLFSAAMEFCYVPAGPFWMGSQDDPDAQNIEQPQEKLEIFYGYWIGRYPVTNAQFGEFVAAGGYREARYWREARAAKYWNSDGYKGWRDNERRQKPRDVGEPYTLPNHPVVEVSWYEGLAYTRWLQEWLTGQIPAEWRVRLPNEPEWEKAARGGVEMPAQKLLRLVTEGLTDERAPTMHPNLQERQRYPWGNEPDANRANYDESGIGATSAVGCFAGGASVYGVEELSGNVWEWTRSLYGEYPYPMSGAERDKRENLAAGSSDSWVLRGGSCYVNKAHVRCAQRYRYYLYLWLNDSGFRVVVSP